MPIQRLAGIATLVLVVVGAATAGWRGALTGFVAGMGVGTGLAIALAERETGVALRGSRVRAIQRIAGLIAAVGAIVGVLYGGWTKGWLWGFLGFLPGPTFALLVGMLARSSAPEAGARSSLAGPLETARRILSRHSKNPRAYENKDRWVLRYACMTLAQIVADEGGLQSAAAASGEPESKVRALLEAAGYDLARLTLGPHKDRVMYSAAASVSLFSDVADEYDASNPEGFST
jgi:hypothetical protein